MKILNKKFKKSSILSASKYFGTFFRILMLVAVGYLVIYPLLFLISTSLKTSEAFFNPMITWLPSEITFQNFKYALKALDLKNSLVSTILFEVLSALFEVASCAIAAYGLARFSFKGKGIFMALLILTIIIPEQMIVLPLTVNYSQFDFFGIITVINKLFSSGIRLNMLDTVFPFWAPSIFGVGLKSGILIYIYIQFFKGLPKELEEAAWIDGAGAYRTFISIAIPSSTVVIFTVLIFSTIWHWNDYSYAAMYVNENYTLSVVLSEITNKMQNIHIWNQETITAVTAASSLIVIAPVLIMYLFAQKRFIKSIDRVGITG